jgi:hypothetical protein
MKRHSFLFLSVFVVVLTFMGLTANNVYADPDDPPLIPMGNNAEGGGGRSSSDVPILCSRQGGLLIFTFTETLGMVDCEVENTATEDVFSTVFQAVAGSSDSIYVSMAPGDYEITLTCANTIYYGEYTIE